MLKVEGQAPLSGRGWSEILYHPRHGLISAKRVCFKGNGCFFGFFAQKECLGGAVDILLVSGRLY